MLSKRLNKIVSLCGKVKRVADVGCDHGKVLAELVKGGANFVVASDISEPSVKKAESLLKEIGAKNFSVRVGNGFETLTNNDNLDVIIVAGMGGLEIIEILKNSKINLKRLILQPQNNVIKLREFLQNNNYYIVYDNIIEDKGKYYNILNVKISDTFHKLTKRELLYGKTNLKKHNPDFISMLKYENQKLLNRANNITNKILLKQILKTIALNQKEIKKASERI